MTEQMYNKRIEIEVRTLTEHKVSYWKNEKDTQYSRESLDVETFFIASDDIETLVSKLEHAARKAAVDPEPNIKISIVTKSETGIYISEDWKCLEKDLKTGGAALVPCSNNRCRTSFVLTENSVGEIAEMLIKAAKGEQL